MPMVPITHFFVQTLISEVLLKAGEVLYVPTQWFHYISNIGVNAQCNRQVVTRTIGGFPLCLLSFLQWG